MCHGSVPANHCGQYVQITHSLWNVSEIFVHNSVTIHIVAHDQIAYACLARKSCPIRKAYALLSSLETHYMRANQPSNANSIVAACMQESERNVDKIEQANAGLDEVKTEVINNIERVLGNADQLNQVIDSTHNLRTSAFEFKKKSGELKTKQLLVLLSLIAALACLVCIIVMIVVIVFVVIFLITQNNSDEDPNMPNP
uniref:V-SNARE coiled-coil homology domain-containing protein n=1 Tax=Percolomonas cosmopolitus TaxID=63605 RepID=A0A7S1KSJ9_9EUKA|mmetsp:Transcript_7176/g.26902  ORF Transcript_7176/g.26902 Transcript_7176/m.26902 type:complete len:199 (+) Transcript_7176:529-1125(+)